MTIFKVTIKKSGEINNVKFTEGQSAEIPCYTSNNPLNSSTLSSIRNAFMRRYRIDVLKAGILNRNYLDVAAV